MRRRFVTLDVFTDRRFAGNPLAVVLDARRARRDGDAGDRARVQPPRNGVRAAAGRPAHRARVRIFTPARELPFAGHPTVGTAVLLGLRDGGARRPRIRCWRRRSARCAARSRRGTDERGSARFVTPAIAGRERPGAGRRDHRRGAGAGARRHRLWRLPSVALVGRQSASPSCRSAGSPHGACRPDPAGFDCARSAASAPAYVFCRRDRRAGSCFPRPHVRARHWASRRIPRPARPPRPLPACSRACGSAGRQPRARHRAGLRDGTAEPDPPRD